MQSSRTPGLPMQQQPYRRSSLFLLSAICALVLAACGGGKSDAPAASGAAPKMPPVQVGVIVATPGDVGLVTELPGRVEAARTAQIRARSAGILQQRLFREGSDVKAGQPLFKIDSAPYAAAVESAKATMARAEANLAQAQAQLERYRPLVAANAISKQDFVNAEAAQKQASERPRSTSDTPQLRPPFPAASGAHWSRRGPSSDKAKQPSWPSCSKSALCT
jgi:membrane fusion protein (multidrug efflux system)